MIALQLYSIPLHMCTTSSWSVVEHLGWFQVLAIVLSAPMNSGVHTSSWMNVFLSNIIVSLISNLWKIRTIWCRYKEMSQGFRQPGFSFTYLKIISFSLQSRSEAANVKKTVFFFFFCLVNLPIITEAKTLMKETHKSHVVLDQVSWIGLE